MTVIAARAGGGELAAFTRLVDAHDLTYRSSDDPRAYRRGAEQRAALRAMAAELDPADVARVWNAAVDQKLRVGSRALFYWPG